MRVVMEILGHSQIAMTMNTYSHVTAQLERDAANQMDALFARGGLNVEEGMFKPGAIRSPDVSGCYLAGKTW